MVILNYYLHTYLTFKAIAKCVQVIKIKITLFMKQKYTNTLEPTPGTAPEALTRRHQVNNSTNLASISP